MVDFVCFKVLLSREVKHSRVGLTKFVTGLGYVMALLLAPAAARPLQYNPCEWWPCDPSCPYYDPCQCLGICDSDFDGVPDAYDQCPAAPGSGNPACPGCPPEACDSDGDGINDAEDRCPGEPGGGTGRCLGCSEMFCCAADVDDSLFVDTADLSLVLLNFGAAAQGESFDLDGNGFVDTADISLILMEFGTCP